MYRTAKYENIRKTNVDPMHFRNINVFVTCGHYILMLNCQKWQVRDFFAILWQFLKYLRSIIKSDYSSNEKQKEIFKMNC